MKLPQFTNIGRSAALLITTLLALLPLTTQAYHVKVCVNPCPATGQALPGMLASVDVYYTNGTPALTKSNELAHAELPFGACYEFDLAKPSNSPDTNGELRVYVVVSLPGWSLTEAVAIDGISTYAALSQIPGQTITSTIWGSALLKIDLILCRDEPPTDPGTGTPGFWKTHPEAWPVDSIVIDGVSYPKLVAIALMQQATKKNKLLNLFEHLVAAKLNGLIGNDTSCITATIVTADAFLTLYPIGTPLPASNPAWKIGDALLATLDQYNNGLLCAPARD